MSAKNLTLVSFTVTDVKDSTGELIVSYPNSYLGLAQSVLVDNRDGTDAVTVRINRGIRSVTIAASSFRTFNDSWIEQLNLTGDSANCEVTAQVVLLSSML